MRKARVFSILLLVAIVVATLPAFGNIATTAADAVTESYALESTHPFSNDYGSTWLVTESSTTETLGGVLTSGVPVTSSLSGTGATEMWTIVVNSGATVMYSVLTCGSADFDLYGRLNAAPTTSTYAWRGYTSGGEEVTYNNPGAGTWYIMVRSYSGSGSYTLTVTITYGGGSGDTLQSGVPATGSLSGTGTTQMWTIAVAADATQMYSVLTCGSADFDLYGRLNAAPTTSTYAWRGYTSGGEEVTYNNPGAGTWYIMVRSYSGSGSYTLTVTITYGGGGGGAEKIAAFFWASDAGAQTVINEYKSVLTAEGYTKFFEFKDTTNFYSDFQTVAAYEDSDDIVFFYLFGHGNNNGAHSYTAFRSGGSSIVYSNTFRTYCDTLDSTKVGLVISSCYSGDWADDMKGGGYFVASSSDETHSSWSVGTLPGEERFANYFFNAVSSGYTAYNAYVYAKGMLPTTGTYVQNPKICNECSYSFFS